MNLKEGALQTILWNIEHIGTAHSVNLTLLKKANSSDLEIDELTNIISQDATISALVLKTANNVHYYRGKKIKTIHQAIVHLGSATIRRLLFAVEMIGIFRANYVSEQFSEIEFWSHSLAGAVLASKYATLHQKCDPDIAYISALIRNIGILAIRQYLPGEFEQMLIFQNTEELPFIILSKRFLGMSHREIGYLLGLRWDLPKCIIESINDTRTTEKISNETRSIREAIQFADDLLHLYQYCTWDTFYKPGESDFHSIPAEKVFNETKILVDEMVKEFWS